MATDQMWLNVINDLEADPVLRGRYQYWEFGYPTGNPIAYSALKLREALAKVDKLYPNHKGYVLIAHSLGGVLSHMQVVTLRRENWERTVGEPARKFLKRCLPAAFSIAGSFLTLIRGSNESSSFAHRIAEANWRSAPLQNWGCVSLLSRAMLPLPSTTQ